MASAPDPPAVPATSPPTAPIAKVEATIVASFLDGLSIVDSNGQAPSTDPAQEQPAAPNQHTGTKASDAETKERAVKKIMDDKIAGVRYCNWDEFKNRHARDDVDPIEVLLADQDIKMLRADHMSKAQGKGGKAIDLTNIAMLRVRINSRPVLRVFQRFANPDTDWTTRSTTFFPPFRAFIYWHSRMTEELAGMKPARTRPRTPAWDDLDSGAQAQNEAADESAESADSTANSDMRCYVRFVETRIMPMKTRWDPGSPNIPSRIRFDDLWYLFRPGELIYFGEKRGGQNMDFPNASRVWRFLNMDVPEPHPEKPKRTESVDIIRKDDKANMDLYYIDFDGMECGAVSQLLQLRYYPGEVDVSSLPFYPLRMAKNQDKIREENSRTGQKFKESVEQKHWSHKGWTLNSGVLGEKIDNADGVEIRSPEYVDSEVITDFQEAVQTYPDWSPRFESADPREAFADIRNDPVDISISEDYDDDRSDRHSAPMYMNNFNEYVVHSDGIDRVERAKLVETDRFLGRQKISIRDLSEEDIILLPKRVFGYALAERKFIHAHVDSLRKVKCDNDGFKSLRIDKGYLRLIQSLVKAHFERKDLEQKQGIDMLGQDSVTGKGRGVVILLHGVPGVGKTLTAEAVAQEYSKPLFAITCGDLGITPETVSDNLMQIFRLANLWDCVLLIDEADVFLSRREKQGHDLQRNALVSGRFHFQSSCPVACSLPSVADANPPPVG